jgi:phytanoyl-CoA hydroxylase
MTTALTQKQANSGPMSVANTTLIEDEYEAAMADPRNHRILDVAPEIDPSTGLHAPQLSDAELEHFEREGFIVLGRVAPPEQIEAMCERIDDIMMGRVVLPNPALFQLCPSAEDLPHYAEHGSAQTKVWKGATLRYHKVQDLEQDLLYLEYMGLPIFRDVTKKIIAEEVSLYRTMFFNKPAMTDEATKARGASGVVINWHQDGNPAKGSGWGLTIDPKITVWTALDDCTIENGALQILPRSHKFPINAEGDQLSPDEWPIHAPVEKRRFVLLKRGEVIVLHNWMLHRSEVNSTSNPRRGFSVCYIDAATSLHSVAPEERGTKTLWPRIFPSFEPATQEEVAG